MIASNILTSNFETQLTVCLSFCKTKNDGLCWDWHKL